MKKILIHSKKINKQGAKIMFQIKIPTDVKQVKGLLIEATRTGLATGITSMQSPFHCGWITLSIPDKRDVFYSDLVEFTEVQQLVTDQIGIAGENSWWLNGTKRDFFSVSVPIENTIIDGYFEDHTVGIQTPYTLKIYLETEQ